MGSTLCRRVTNNQVFSRLLHCLTRFFFCSILACLVLATIGALIPRKWGIYSKHNCNLKICVSNTGIHTNIIVPIKNNVFDWHQYLYVDDIGIDTAVDYNYLSFGWGDRNFYMLTPSAANINFSNTFKALFLSTSSVLEVQGYQSIPNYLDVRCIKVNSNDYLQLMAFIQATFQVDALGRKIRLGNGHSGNAGFYAAIGSYSILRNCNSWTAEGLRKADVNTPLWDGLSSPILWQLRSGCE